MKECPSLHREPAKKKVRHHVVVAPVVDDDKKATRKRPEEKQFPREGPLDTDSFLLARLVLFFLVFSNGQTCTLDKMKMRGLRRKKKTTEEVDRELVAESFTPRKGFRRRIPAHVIVGSPLRRFSFNSNLSKEMSTLTTEEETQENGESLAAFVTPEKNSDSSSLMAPTVASRSALQMVEDIGLVDCVVDWLDATGSLASCSEMHRFLHSSGQLILSAGGVAIRTACLPITLPLQVANQTTGFVVGNCVMPLFGVTQLLLQNHHHQQEHGGYSPRQSACEDDDDRGDQNLIVQAARSVWGLPGHVFGFANHVKDELGGIVLRTLAPALNGTIQESCRPGESSSEARNRGNVLERLRLDYPDEPLDDSKIFLKTSFFLLRVDDLNITNAECDLVHYVDLGSMQDEVVLRSLDRLVHVGVSLLANHPTVRLANHPHVAPREHEIEWKPEGNTWKLIRRLSNCDVLTRLEVLQKETLIWSGRFQHDHKNGYDRQSRFYLARGILNMSPRTLLHLLWDNSRTSEYNRYCVARTTLTGNDTEFLEGEDKVGTKIIESETRVPLTSISVRVKCLMHARALPDDAGYVIVSRSCTTGPQGTHNTPLNGAVKPKNEILWGLNILRRVPNRENMVDLTSHSQVGTAGVPQFLSGKIALMGVEGFFENARKLGR